MMLTDTKSYDDVPVNKQREIGGIRGRLRGRGTRSRIRTAKPPRFHDPDYPDYPSDYTQVYFNPVQFMIIIVHYVVCSVNLI